MEYNVYCDESCHLTSNDSKYMLIGAIRIPKEKVKLVNNYIKELKEKYNISNNIELKWNKVSKKTLNLYLDIVNYFFKTDYLNFRVIVIDKTKLNHKKYNQTENDFYQKENYYNIYPDIKDTNSYYYLQITLNYLRIKFESKDIIKKIQPIRSYEAPIIQMNDILIGALSYYYRDLKTNEAKNEIVKQIEKLYGKSLEKSSNYLNKKFNIFIWSSKDDIN